MTTPPPMPSKPAAKPTSAPMPRYAAHSMSATEEVSRELGETGTVARACHEFRLRRQPACEPLHVRHTDGLGEIPKHRRVVGRIAYVERGLNPIQLEMACQEIA